MSPAFVAVPVILVFPILVVDDNDWDKLQLLVHWMAAVKTAFLHYRIRLRVEHGGALLRESNPRVFPLSV